MTFKYINISNFEYLTNGLTLTLSDVNVLEEALLALDKHEAFIKKIIDHNYGNGCESILDYSGPQIMIFLDILGYEGKDITTATIVANKEKVDTSPVLLINLHSPSLNIPQRIEIPLRYVLNGIPPLENTHMVYLHALQINGFDTFQYYGVTKRGWMKRFMEHLKIGFKGKTSRKFPKLLGESILARYDELDKKYRISTNGISSILTGTYHVVCAAGRTRHDAYAIEGYLIGKYTISSRLGLNMIKGHSNQPTDG